MPLTQIKTSGIADAAVTEPKLATGVTNISGTTYTLQADDAGTLLAFDSQSPVILTVPDNASEPIDIGTHFPLGQIGDGAVTVVGDTGVTVESLAGSTAKTIGDGAVANLVKRATDTWLLSGDIEPGSTTQPGSQVFTASGTFIAPQTGTYRVLAVGGGGAGSPDEGAGGGSGYVAYTTVALSQNDQVAVAIGSAGVTSGSPTAGGTTSFGQYVSASGGEAGLGNNQPGGDGGSGGAGDPNASSQPQVGGSNGSSGTTSGAGGGTGQGSSFSADFNSFVQHALTAGAGGSSDTSNASGGGGGGGVVLDGDTTVAAGPNAVSTAFGGVGYGAGGAGGNGSTSNRAGSDGVAGLLVIEWS